MTSHDSGLFASTADSYRRFRSGVPDEVAKLLDDLAPSGHPRRLLDVGTGPGFAIRALLPFFDEAVGVDIDTDLLRIARADLPMEKVRLVEAPADSFELDGGWRAHLVTVCRAYHWFDPHTFLPHVIRFLDAGAKLVVMGDRSIWAGGEEWKTRARTVVQEFLGERRRAGAGTYSADARDFRQELVDAGFEDVTTSTVPATRSRTAAEVVGLMHSMSFASPALLGDRLEAFDERLADALEPLVDADGLLHDANEFFVYVGTRP